MNGPLPPDELARIQSYWGGSNVSSHAAAPPPPPPAGPPPPPPAEPPPPPPNDATFGMNLNAPVPPPQVPVNLPVQEVTGAPPNAPPPANAPFVPPVAPPGQATGGLVRAPVINRPKPGRPGGGGPGNPDPYGVKAAQSGLIGTYGEQMGGQRREGAAEAAKAERIGELGQQSAREMEEDAAIERATVDEHERVLNDRMNDVSQQLDALKTQKVDPGRMFPDAGSKAFAIVGGILGGLYQGWTRSPSNPFLDQMNKMIDRDIASQEKNIDNQRAGVEGQMNLMGQLRTTFKDNQVARLQARNLYYEGMKQQIAGEASHYDSGIVQARADQAISQIDRQQKQLQLEIAKQLQAQAAAAAAQRAAQLKEAQNFHKDIYLAILKEGATVEQAEAEANRQTMIMYGGGAGPRGEPGFGGKASPETAHAKSEIATALTKPEYLEAKSTIEELRPQFSALKEGDALPGVGRGADLREKLAPPIGTSPYHDIPGALGPAGWAARGGSAWALGLNDQERLNRKNIERVALAYKHAVTGASSNAKEGEDIYNAFIGAKTPAEVASVFRHADDVLNRYETNIKAQDPRAASQYDAAVKQINAAKPGAIPYREPTGGQ